MKQLLETYTRYNQWANRRIADILVTLPAELLDKEVKSSFPSIRKTVNHLWDAELAWLARLRGETPSWPPSAQFDSPGIADFVITSDGIVSFVDAKHEDYFLELCEYVDSKGNRYANPVSGIIMHSMNHSTFHRGQIVTLLRQLDAGANLTSTDIITYIRESKP